MFKYEANSSRYAEGQPSSKDPVWVSNWVWEGCVITPTPYMVLPLFATRFAAYAGGIQVSFIQPRLFNLI